MEIRIGKPLPFDELPEHIKEWSRLSDAEVNRHKAKHCRNCMYLSRHTSSFTNSTCDYMVMTGEMRGCSPLHCDKKKLSTGKRRVASPLPTQKRKAEQ